MIRTLQDHGIHQGIAVYMERTVIRLLKDGDRIAGALGLRPRARPLRLFKAKAVVLATGGIGKAYKITSNSWEYTGDGHTLAYDAGAELIDMEFVQFHPTGMVWPPSVRGILVTEGVRGEGGVLRNNKGERFMFGDIPDNYKPQTADNEEEGFRYVARRQERPPPAGTADARPRRPLHRPRGQRGPRQPARRRLPRTANLRRVDRQEDTGFNAAEHWKKKLPSMYHQFKELGGLDITQGADGSRPDDALRHGRRPRGQRHADVARPRPVRRAASAPPASTAPTASAATRSPTCSCFGKRAGEYAAKYAEGQRRRRNVTTTRSRRRGEVGARAVRPRRGGENPYPGPARLAGHDAGPGRHRPQGRRDAAGARRPAEAAATGPRRCRSTGNREYNPGWHTAMDLHNLLTVSEAITRAAIVRKESRGGQFRDDYPTKDNDELRQGQHRSSGKGPDGDDADPPASRSRRCRTN